MDLNFSKLTTQPQDDSLNHVQVLILGSGPAGLAAALYAARANLDPVILSGMELGGQVSLTHIVENYPGFPDGVGGNELVDLFQRQAEKFGARLEFDTATEIDLSSRPFRIKTYNSSYIAESIIVATGATPRHLNIPGEKEYTGKGVSYCATCDGWFFKEKDLIVVGGGDSALEEGLFLTRFANSVTIVHRRDELRAGPILVDRAKSNPKIKFIWNTIVKEIKGEATLDSIQIENLESGHEYEHKTDGVFIFIGHIPNSQIFKGQLEMDDSGYLKINELMQTNVPGVFAAGEIADHHFRQVITSAGMGAAAAIQAGHFLENHQISSI